MSMVVDRIMGVDCLLLPDVRHRAVVFVLACLTALPGVALAAAGHIQFVKGEVRIVGADRRERPAKKGDALEERDAVITGAQSFAQLRMIDDGLISMRPDTHLRIDTYRYAGRQDGTERGVLGLVKGGFRTLTGVIGRANKSNYTVRTPNATIGIRGTDHEPFYIPPPLPGEFPLGPPGTYNRVNVGETYIEVGGVRFELGPNEVGFAAFAGGLPPVRLDRLPGFMRATLVQQSRDVQRAVRALSTADAGSGARGTAPSALGTLLALLWGRPVLETRTATGTSLTSGAAQMTPLAPGFAYTAGDRSIDAGGNVVVGSGALTTGIGGASVFLGPDGNPAVSAAPFGAQYIRADAPLVSASSDTFLDFSSQPVKINWGVYAGGNLVDSFGVRVVQGLHFAFAPATPAAIQASLSGSYTILVSSPPLITEAGVIGGGVTSAAITLSTGQLTSYSVNATDALARTWNGSFGGAVPLSDFAQQGVPLFGSGPGGVALGVANGVPIGPDGRGVLSSFDLKTGTGNAVTGSFAVKQ